MYCFYQLRDPQNPAASWQLAALFSQAELDAVIASTPSNLEVHVVLLQNVSVSVVNGGMSNNQQSVTNNV